IFGLFLSFTILVELIVSFTYCQCRFKNSFLDIGSTRSKRISKIKCSLIKRIRCCAIHTRKKAIHKRTGQTASQIPQELNIVRSANLSQFLLEIVFEIAQCRKHFVGKLNTKSSTQTVG